MSGLKLPENAHSSEPTALLEQLKVDPGMGLDAAEVERRLEQFGPNRLQAEKEISPWAILLRQFQDLMVLILLAATGVAFLSWYLEGAEGFPSDAVVILAIVLANAALGFSQEFKAEKTIEELARSTSAKARVLRSGKVQSLEQEALVPGDIVLLSEGDRVPADLILVEASHLAANESMLTGESVPATKSVGPVEESAALDERNCEMFAGTTITAGQGKGVVVQVGSNTELGDIARSLESTESEETPLERRLDVLGRRIGWGVLALTIIIGGTVLLVEGKTDSATLARVAMFSVALAVAAVPEGLPAVLTVSLSAGARRLAQHKAVARRMAAVETLGSVTTIVTDKTGTLTHNQMTIRRLFEKQDMVTVTGDGYSPEGEISPLNDQVKALIQAGLLASGADLEEDEKGRVQAVGDPMDAAFLVLAEKAGLDWQELRKKAPIRDEAPFSSDRARVSILREGDKGCVLYCKGALSVVAELCSVTEAGEPISEKVLQPFAEAELEFAEQGLRTLAVAYKPDAGLEAEAQEQEEGMTLLGLAAFEDPPRKEVAPALERCREASIRVVMCTGDHPATASAIARQIVLSPDTEQITAVTGPELAAMPQDQFAESLQEHAVLARVSPAQKLRVVETLISSGQVLAMTGDGVNDAPALKKVHVGVAMGRSGTAVAVEASDLVLMDDNFATIVKAIEEGRSVFQNVQRFIAFLFSGNFGVVLAMFAGTILAGIFDIRFDGQILLPLSAAQILWMNLVTDGAPALAFALGRSAGDSMKQPPRDPEAAIIEWRDWLLVFLSGAALCALFLLILDLLYLGGVWHWFGTDPIYARSAAFFTLVTARLINAFNFLDLEGSLFRAEAWKNGYVPAAALFSWLLTIGVFYIEPLANMFSVQALELSHLAILTLVSFPVVIVPAELYKRFRR